MAHSNERIEFLRESRQFYKQEVPPFTQRGNVSHKRDVMILPPYVDKPRKATVVYLLYKLEGGDRTFACLRMNRQRYIVKAMKRTWETGDPIDNTGGSCYWYRWQGPNAGKQFIGPVAVSMARYVANNPTRGAPLDDEDPRGQPYQDARRDSTNEDPDDGGALTGEPAFPPSTGETFHGASSSSRVSPGLNRPKPRVHPEDLPHQARVSKSRMKIVSTRKSASTTIPQKRQPLPERSTKVLSPGQEQATILHVERLEDNVAPIKMKLSSAAVPKDDPEKRVTHASFFDLVTRIVNPISQPDLIQAAFHQPPSQGDNEEPCVQTISISYLLEETFDQFLSKIRACFEEHYLKGGDSKSFECHIVIKSTVIIP